MDIYFEGGLIYLAVTVVFGLFAGWLAKSKGYPWGLGFVVGFMLGPFGLIVIAPFVVDFKWAKRSGGWELVLNAAAIN